MNVNVFVETEGLSQKDWLKYRKRGIGGSAPGSGLSGGGGGLCTAERVEGVD